MSQANPSRRPLPDYVKKVQRDITPNMRGILVDWLVEVAEEYNLVSDTLYLTVSYIDKYLSLNALSRHKLQLLGVSAMLIASSVYKGFTLHYLELGLFIYYDHLHVLLLTLFFFFGCL